MIDFVDDYDTMKTSGVTFQGKQFPLELSAIICDSPACSFVKNLKGILVRLDVSDAFCQVNGMDE